MTILDQIIKDKLADVELLKQQVSMRDLEQKSLFCHNTTSMKGSILSKSGIIAEFKRKSPSKSNINISADVVSITKGYENSGASALSILTNEKYFGGSVDDILKVRNNISIPILRKEFIVDEFQIIEAKSIGADAILLIATSLTKEQIISFSKLAKSLKLEVLLEIHNEEESRKIVDGIDMVGVNNRNLKTFITDIKTSEVLSNFIPNDFVKISESGIDNPEAVKHLKTFGYKGFLIGECFMKTNNPAEELTKFLLDADLL